MLFCLGFQHVILLKQYKMANIQSKEVAESNKDKLSLLHDKFGFKTILRLTGDKGKRKKKIKKSSQISKE